MSFFWTSSITNEPENSLDTGVTVSNSRPSSSLQQQNKNIKERFGGIETESRQVPFLPDENLTIESIYDFYVHTLFPAVMSSLPLLGRRLFHDTQSVLHDSFQRFVNFILPDYWTSSSSYSHPQLPSFRRIWEENAADLSVSDFLLRHFDTNHDGKISPEELFHVDEMLLSRILPRSDETWWSWFSREWPLLDWKVGLFLWRTFGGVLLTLAVLSIVPGRLHGWSARVLRWPILGLTYFLIAVELMVYIVIRIFIRIAEYIIARPKHRALRQQMAKSQSYEEWYGYAEDLDRSQKRDVWIRRIKDQTSFHYNWSFVQDLIRDLRNAREQGDSILALAVIQQCTRKNVGGIMSEDLFSYTNTGEPKAVVREFIEEAVQTLHWLTDEALHIPVDDSAQQQSNEKRTYEEQMEETVQAEKDKIWKSLTNLFGNGEDGKQNDDVKTKDGNETHSPESAPHQDIESRTDNPLPSFHRQEVLTFLKRARAAYGRTALCLSGGAMMGVYHFGHVRALLETGSLPNIISGTSAGSIIGAILCTRKDDELDRDLRPEILVHKLTCFSRPWRERISSLVKTGSMFDVDEWLELLKWFCRGDMTFAEAYRLTGRVFCITLSPTTKKAPPVLINYLSAPNVTIASAVVASAAVPGFVAPVRLRIKDSNGVVQKGGAKDEAYFDGSIKQDIPTTGLAEMLNCQFFVTAQCNPHIVPMFYNSKGGVGRPSRWSSGAQEDSWRGGFLLAALEMYLKNDMKAKFVFLRDLEAAVGFTSELLTQDFVGTTTIVPQVSFKDYFGLFENPSLEQLQRCCHAGSVAAYEHTVMIQMHYSISDALEECIAKLETNKRKVHIRRRTKLGSASMTRGDPKGGVVEESTEARIQPTVENTQTFLVGGLTSDGLKVRTAFNESSDDTDRESEYDEFEADWTDLK
jgi:predicted acylesterase/phospholipase RssA/uncharacterized membrane protein